MATAKQIAANRGNALFSTGPRTEAGKQIASQNSTTHGLTGQTISRCPAQERAYDAYYESMLPDLAPATALELDFAKRIIHDSWRLNRAGAMNENLLMNGWHEHRNGYAMGDNDEDHALAEARAFRADAKTFNLLSLYEQRLQRAILKNLAALKAMQKERISQAQPAPKPAPAVRKPSAQPVETPVPSPEIGFVCSTPPSDPAPAPPAVSNDPETMAA
jgi:hypothetical protein